MAKPISDHCEGVLRACARRPVVSQEINPGARGRLLQAGYVEIVRAPSPFKKHKPNTLIDHYAATEKGRKYLEDGI